MYKKENWAKDKLEKKREALQRKILQTVDILNANSQIFPTLLLQGKW